MWGVQHCVLIDPGENVGPSGLLPFHEVGQLAMQSRFAQLSEVLTCATLTNYPSPSPGAYAWIQCKENCTDCLLKSTFSLSQGFSLEVTRNVRSPSIRELQMYLTLGMLSLHQVVCHLTLGAHAQRGLLCVSVCLSVTD